MNSDVFCRVIGLKYCWVGLKIVKQLSGEK